MWGLQPSNGYGEPGEPDTLHGVPRQGEELDPYYSTEGDTAFQQHAHVTLKQ